MGFEAASFERRIGFRAFALGLAASEVTAVLCRFLVLDRAVFGFSGAA